MVRGTGSVRVSLEQRFHRDQGKVVFDGVPEMTELKVGESLVDWKDERAVDSSRFLTTAPIGGRIIRFDQPGFEIWIPEGWKMQWEPNATDPNRTPVWFRERDPHGGLRLRVHTYRGAPSPWDPLGEARKEADARRKREGIESVLLDENREHPTLTYKFFAKGPQLDHPWKATVFKVFDSKGAIELMWMNHAEKKESETLEELASVKEIANRITRLLPK